jgi:hypothetical protein
MTKTAPDPLLRVSWDAATLMEQHPLRFTHSSKEHAFGLVLPPGTVHAGAVEVTRWAAMPLLGVIPSGEGLRVEVLPNPYEYAPVASPTPAREWHVNFADGNLFFGYGSWLFAQDELQVLEHPALGAVREALLAGGHRALTLEGEVPTPVLVHGVERRCRISTTPDASAGRPNGLYGKECSRATDAQRASGITLVDPPTVSHIIAIAAPSHGKGAYTREQVETILVTAYTGFRAAVLESQRDGLGTVIHSGFWGCGAFGGNRVMMLLLQQVAAQLAGVERLVLHAMDEEGVGVAKAAGVRVEEVVGQEEIGTAEVIERVVAMGLRWGVGNGT